MSTRQNLYSVDAAFNRLEYSGDHMSSKSDVDDDFTPTMTPESDTTDSSDSREAKGYQTQGCLLFIIFITKL